MEINLDGLTLNDAGITMNMEPNADNIAILDHCLIGRVLTDKEVCVAYLRERLGRLWRLVKGVTILLRLDDKFLFQFNHRLDAENVLTKGSWVYDGCNMVVEWIMPCMVAKDVPLNFLDIWVQVKNLPKVGHAIAQHLGEFKEYDRLNTLNSSFMKLKVRINVSEPLNQEWRIRREGGEWVTMVFRYESLGLFCYACGILGHSDRTCELLFDKDVDDGVRGWGANLKPDPRKVGTAANNRWLRDPMKADVGSSDAKNSTATPTKCVNHEEVLAESSQENSMVVLKFDMSVAKKSGNLILNVAGTSNLLELPQSEMNNTAGPSIPR